jgi:F-type H+-transporting ATPase subunit b
VRQHTSLPIGVGFGISDAASAKAVAVHADAVVIGSAIIKLMEQQVAELLVALAPLEEHSQLQLIHGDFCFNNILCDPLYTAIRLIDPRGEAAPGGTLPPGFEYVPAGWAWIGGDALVSNAPSRRRLWIDGFVMAAQHVTHAEYLEFLNDLVARGRGDEAFSLRPRARDEAGEGLYGFVEGQGYRLLESPTLRSDLPVSFVDSRGAWAYCAWRAERDGMLREAREMADKVVAEAKAKAKDEASKEAESARQAIATERKAAVAELKAEVAKLSVTIAEQLIRAELSSDDKQQALVQKLIDESPLN